MGPEIKGLEKKVRHPGWQMAAANLCCDLQSNGLLSCIIGFIQIHEDEVGNKDKAVDSLSHSLYIYFDSLFF